MRRALLVALALCCAADSARAASGAPLVGGDRDAHGCIGSAGYQWCAREKSCVRSWELAAQRGFPNTPRAFRRWCRR